MTLAGQDAQMSFNVLMSVLCLHILQKSTWQWP